MLKSGQDIDHHISAFQVTANTGRGAGRGFYLGFLQPLCNPYIPFGDSPGAGDAPLSQGIQRQGIPGICLFSSEHC